MAGWALALALLICIPFGFLVAIGLAIAVLVKSKDGRDHGRKMAIWAIVISSIWLVVQIGVFVFALFQGVTGGVDAPRDSQGNITDRAEMSIQQLRVGDCFDDEFLLGSDEPGGAGVTVDAVPCSRLHSFQMFHAFDVAGGDYPGEDKMYDLALRGCESAVLDFLGNRAGRLKDLEVYLYYPQERTWNLLRDHSVQCSLGDVSGPVTGTLYGGSGAVTPG